MNGIDTELASFLRTVVSIESERQSAIEVLKSDVLRNSDVKDQNHPLNCIAIQRIYYSSKGERMPQGLQLTNPTCEGLSRDYSTTTSKDCFANNNECTSTKGVHCGPPNITFPDQICKQTTRDSLPLKKRRSIETTNAEQQDKKHGNCKIRKAENTHYPIVSETFQEASVTTFEERLRNVNRNGYDQVQGTRTPRLRGTKSGASSAGIVGLFNFGHTRSFNKGTEPCASHDIELQRFNQLTNENTSCEVLKRKTSFTDAGPVIPRCSCNVVSYPQERHSINSHIKEKVNSTPLKGDFDHTTTQRQTAQSQEIAEETRKGCHAMSIRESGRQKLLPHVHNRHNDGEDYIMWNGKCYQGLQASREYKLATDKDYNAAGLNTSRDVEPPKSTFAQSCSTVQATEQTTTTLRTATKRVPAFSESRSANILNSKTRKNLTLTTKRNIFMCTLQTCSGIFRTRAGLICHQSLHTGERYYTCPWENCDKTLRTSNERLRHFQKHTGEKPYECLYCAKCFTRSDHRGTHVKKMHSEK